MRLGISVILILSSLLSFGQLPNGVFMDADSLVAADSGRLSLSLRTMGFTKNNEYFNGIADGYTLFGTQLNPRLRYQVNSVFSLEAGVYYRDDFGNPGIERLLPTVTFRARYLGADILLGTLDGALNHQLIEPMYDFERTLVDRIENGVQIRVDQPGLFADLWVEWETMIYPGSPYQEEMYGGFSFSKDWGGTRWSTPVQVVIYHRGGQIDSSPAPLRTLGNFTAGLVRRDNIGERIEVENSFYYLFYKEFSREPVLIFNDGAGYYANSLWKLPHGINLMLSYWRGEEFITLLGGKRYPSVSSRFKNPDYLEPVRQLLILRLMHDVQLGRRIWMSTRIEPFYDFNRRKIEFFNALYFQYRDIFSLNR